MPSNPYDISAELGPLIGRARSYPDTSPSPPEPPPPPLLTPEPVWNQEQRDAISKITSWRSDSAAPRFMSLTGAAGAGKTSILRALKPRLGYNVAWAAMTGKAASRMREAAGVKAKTLHSVLYHPPREVDNREYQKIDLDFAEVKSASTSTLVLDEGSMIGPRIFSDLERSSYKKILLVGDPYQLPPVLSKQEGAVSGDDYSVFRQVPGPFLGTVMRASGAVLRAATKVRELQQIPEESGTDASTYEYVSATDPDNSLLHALTRYFEDPIDHVVVTWKNDQRMRANEIIRTKLGHKDPFPQPGENAVVRKNVPGAGIMNSDVVEIDEWLDVGPTLCGITTRYLSVIVEGEYERTSTTLLVPTRSFEGSVPYVGLAELRRAMESAKVDDLVPITYAYCRTGHMMQGSEARRVTTFIPGDLRNKNFAKMTRLPDGTVMPFAMRFLYVAISRAQKHASLIISR